MNKGFFYGEHTENYGIMIENTIPVGVELGYAMFYRDDVMITPCWFLGWPGVTQVLNCESWNFPWHLKCCAGFHS